MKKFLRFLLFLIIVAIVIFLASKNYTANILRKSSAKLDELEGKDLKLAITMITKNEDGSVKDTKKTEHCFYQGDYATKNVTEQTNEDVTTSIYADSRNHLILMVNKKEGKESYMVSSHEMFHYEKVKSHFPILYSDTDSLLAWDDSMPIYMNLTKLLYTPSFTKSASENGRNYYVISSKDAEYWIDKGDYRLYKYIDKSDANINPETKEKYYLEGIYEYEEAATPEDVEWPDLSGKDVIFI